MSYTFNSFFGGWGVGWGVCVVGVGGGGGGGVPYLALSGMFWWDCALRVYRISYSG